MQKEYADGKEESQMDYQSTGKQREESQAHRQEKTITPVILL